MSEASSAKIDIKTAGGQSVKAIHKTPLTLSPIEREKTLIIMLHGFPGHKAAQNDLFADLEFILLDKEFHTLRFDFRGCGQSEGYEEDLTFASVREDIESVIRWAEKTGYKDFVFIAEGLGATFGMLNIPLSLRCFVMLWPGLNLKFLAKSLFHSEDFQTEWKEQGYAVLDNHHIGTRFIRELKTVNLAPACKEVVMPTLILQGAEDKLYPVEQLNLARKHIVSKRFEITTFHDGEHGLPALNHRKMVFFHITQFLNKYM